jgi:zinc transport system ATP-binding protein
VSVVRIERGCVEFDGDHVLDDIDLVIDPGEFVALLGPNGSGKTTLVRAMLGLQPLAHGKAWLFDTPVPRFRQWDKVAWVPQRLLGASSIPVSVWETVLSGRITPRSRWRPFSRQAKDAASRALEEVGLAHRRHDRLDALSGGQQRRVLIARALATTAQLLVMDEPTAGVDAENIAHLVHLLAGLKASGTTIVIVTHDLDDIEPLVTRAIALRGGKHHGSVRYDGPPPVPGLADEVIHHHDPDPDAPATVRIDP